MKAAHFICQTDRRQYNFLNTNLYLFGIFGSGFGNSIFGINIIQMVFIIIKSSKVIFLDDFSGFIRFKIYRLLAYR